MESAADPEFCEALNYLLSARLLEAGGLRVMDETRELTIKNYRKRWTAFVEGTARAL